MNCNDACSIRLYASKVYLIKRVSSTILKYSLKYTDLLKKFFKNLARKARKK